LKRIEGKIATCPDLSRPTWARGLKQIGESTTPKKALVAPHVGAWIETPDALAAQIAAESRPTWARGLKPSS